MAIYIFSFLCLSFLVYTANTQSEDPQKSISELVEIISKNIVSDEVIKDAASQDMTLFEKYRKDNQKHHKKISQYIDFEKLGGDSMPKKWQEKYWFIKRDEKKKFLDLLQILIEEIVYPRGKDFFEKVKITYKKPIYSHDQKEAKVLSRIMIKDKKVELWYKLVRKGAGWKIYDVNLEGEWWTESFKSQFNHIITTKSYSELISAMEKKLKNVQAGTSF